MLNFEAVSLVQISLRSVLISTLVVAAFCDIFSEKSQIESSKSSLNYEHVDKSVLTHPALDEERSEGIKKRLVCFYVFTKCFSPDVMDGLCTHIIVGFISINKQNYSLEISNENEQILSQITLLKRNMKDLKIIICVGGVGDMGFSSMVTHHTTRKMFIRSCMSVLKKFRIDGVDLDWEWPVVSNGNAKEKIKFVQLLHEIREEFDRHEKQYSLSVDVSATPAVSELAYYVQYLANYVNFISIMGYDYNFYSILHPFTGHNAPLFSMPGLLAKSINDSVYFYISNSMPREKIVVGVPTFGHTFKLVFPRHHSLISPAKGFGSVGQNGFVVYQEICEFLKQNDTVVVYDSFSKVPYAYQFLEWISFDDEGSLAIKANYILEEELGGAMVFSVNADDFTGNCKGDGVPLPLIRKIRNILLNEV